MSNLLIEYDNRLKEREIGLSTEIQFDLANLKFNPNGEIKPYFGLTCITWIERDSQLYQNLSDVQKNIRTELKQNNLDSVFVFLIPESFHMTICDISASATPITLDEIIHGKKRIHGAFSGGITMHPISSQVLGIGLRSTITALVRFENHVELEKVLQLEQNIKES